jgi:hypothetical protein
MALIDGRGNSLARPTMSESELTQHWLKHGHAVLAESERREAWRNPPPASEPPTTKLGGEPAATTGTAPRKRKKPRVNTTSFERTQELEDMASRMAKGEAQGQVRDDELQRLGKERVRILLETGYFKRLDEQARRQRLAHDKRRAQALKTLRRIRKR